MKTILCILAVLIAFAPACRSGGSSAPVQPAPTITGEWMIKSLQGKPVAAAKLPWIRVESGGGLSGWAGVNQISSQLDQSALGRGEFKPSPIISTRMAGPPEAMKLETDVLAALQNARAFVINAEVLELRSDSGVSVASFTRQTMKAPGGLVEGEWFLARLNGKGVAANPPPRLTIAGGEASGWGGVNKFTATLTRDEPPSGKFGFTSFTSTEMAGAPEARALERELFAALLSTASFQEIKGQLDLRAESGKVLCSFIRKGN